MRRCLYILLFFIIFSIPANADRAYPITYSLEKIIENGRLYVTEGTGGFLLKQKFIDEETTLQIQDKIDGNTLQIVHLGNIIIADACVVEDKILILATEKDQYSILFIDNRGKILEKIPIKEKPNGDAKIAEINKKSGLLLIDRKLIRVALDGAVSIMYIADNVTNATHIQKSNSIAFISITQSGMNLNIAYPDGKQEILSKLSAYENSKLYSFGDTLVVLSGGLNYGNSTLMQVITLKHGIAYENWIEANIALTEVLMLNRKISVLYLKTNDENYICLQSVKSGKPIYTNFLNERLIEPYKFKIDDQEAIIVFRNGIVRFEIETGVLKAIDYLPLGKHFQNDDITVGFSDKDIILTSGETSLICRRQSNELWLLTRYYRQAGKILIPLCFAVIILILLRFYRKQKKLLDILQEHSGRGVIFLLDKTGKLLRCNNSGKELLSISESIPKKKNFMYYCINPELQNLREWVTNTLNSRDSGKQKIIISSGNSANEWLFNAVALRNFAGRFRGLVVNGIDITEELEKKRLNNWASLAHDMQTNLSTIRLNAEQLDIDKESDNYMRREKIIHQVNVLIQRVRDIVTVGRSNSIDRQQYDAADICNEVISEFDSNMFPHVTFVLQPKSMKVFCDKPKMIRALRNAVENAIRALKGKNGTITVSNYSDNRNMCFVVRDSGVGMDQKTKSKMLTPYFTTGAKEGGFGIGTMIMQHVVELHGGEIIINSEANQGTELIFSIPNYTGGRSGKKIR